MHNKIDVDYKLRKAFTTPKDWRDHRCHSYGRSAARACGLNPSKKQVVHHRNGKPCDQRCNNLVLMGRIEHRKSHSKSKVFDAPCRDLVKEFF
jgi:hypothetical protein